MEPLRLSQIAEATGGRLLGDDLAVTGVSTDSRKIVKGELFIPIIGESFDGHDYIGMALEKGAPAFVSRKANVHTAPYVLVTDTRRALGDLATYYRSRFDIPVAAVTGSSGKTSVKNGIAAVLAQKYKVLKTDGNFNNDIGLPLTVFKLNKSHTAAVLEMGMNSFGEISRLSEIVKPEIGIITNIGTAHIEHLGSREGIMRAKLEIVDGMSGNGTLVLNYDDEMSRRIKGKVSQSIVWVSAETKADVYVKDIMSTPMGETGFTLCCRERRIGVSIRESARPLIVNALMSAAVGFLLGLTDEEIKAGVEADVSENKRRETHKTKTGGIIINDCYNANTESMKLALDMLSEYKLRRVAILGDMFEQGEYAKPFHEEIGEYAYKAGTNMLIAIGSDARYYKSAFDALGDNGAESHHFESKQAFFDAGLNLDGAAILIKASRGMRFEEIFEFLNG